MKLSKTEFKDLIIISHDLFDDKRGSFKEVYRKKELEKITGYEIEFCQDNSVYSKKNVFRGLHFQMSPYRQAKLISVSLGEILDIAVDIRKDSKSYGKYFSRILSAKQNESVFIPKGFAHGYLTLSKEAIINYKVDNYYNADFESGIAYDDNYLNINLPIKKNEIIISKKDKKLKNFKWL